MLEKDVAKDRTQSGKKESTGLDDFPIQATKNVDVAEQLGVPGLAHPAHLLQLGLAGGRQSDVHPGLEPGLLLVLLHDDRDGFQMVLDCS